MAKNSGELVAVGRKDWGKPSMDLDNVSKLVWLFTAAMGDEEQKSAGVCAGADITGVGEVVGAALCCGIE